MENYSYSGATNEDGYHVVKYPKLDYKNHATLAYDNNVKASIASNIVNTVAASQSITREELADLLSAMEGRIMQQVCDELTRIEQVIMEALSD